MILAAGYGLRLGELTKEIPKPMLPLDGGIPLLAYTLGHLRRHGIHEIAINLHFRPEVILDYFGKGERFGVSLTFLIEEELSGTAGAVKKLEWFFRDAAPFLVVYGDVVFTDNPSRLLRSHEQTAAFATLMVHERAGANSALEMDPNGRIIRFEERPSSPIVPSRPDQKLWVNSGVQVLSQRVLDVIPSDSVCDLPKDVYAQHVRDEILLGVPVLGFRCAVDSAERYDLVKEASASGVLKL